MAGITITRTNAGRGVGGYREELSVGLNRYSAGGNQQL